MVRRPISTNESVSTLLRPPPIWARISSDPICEPLPFFNIYQPPPLIRIDGASTCACTIPRPIYNPSLPIFTRECTVYSFEGCIKTSIQLQKCPACKHRYIGPDCHSYGLFNFNNRTLLTRQLLDDYTNQFTTSETPFIAWVTVTARRYEEIQTSSRLPRIPFINDRLFRAVWFSYIRLIRLESDMICPTCGPSPRAVIFDGVTLAFNRKNLRSTLEPPTSIHPTSIKKDAVRRVPNLQCIPITKLRHALRDVLTGPQLLVSLLPDVSCLNSDSDTETDTDSGATDNNTEIPNRSKKSQTKKFRAMQARIKKIPKVLQGLKDIDPHLVSFFDRCYGPVAVMSNLDTPQIYQRLLLQVRISIPFIVEVFDCFSPDRSGRKLPTAHE